MTRRLLAAALLVLTLSTVMIVPAAAQVDSQYDIRSVTLISQGEERSFYRVVTGERTLSMDQADEVCQDVGADYAIGIRRYREAGERMTDVTCASDELLPGQVEVGGVVAGDNVAIYAGACVDVDLSTDIPVAVVNVTNETTVTFEDLEPGVYCVVLNGGTPNALANAIDIEVESAGTETVTFTLGELDVTATNFGVQTQGQTIRFYTAMLGDVTEGPVASQNCAGTFITETIIVGDGDMDGFNEATILVEPGEYCVEADVIGGTDAEFASVTALERGLIDATITFPNGDPAP